MSTASNILAGPVRILIGASANAGSPDALPADTVALGGSWLGTWVDVGYTTDAGVVLHLENAWSPVPTAQESTPATYFPGEVNDRISATLLENTLTNLKYAIGRGTIASVAAGGSPGHDELTISDPSSPTYVAVGLEWVAPPNTKANPRRVIFPLAMATEATEQNYRRTTPAGIPVTFMRVGNATASAPKIRDVTTL